jgi:SH3 domain-containing protein
LIAPSERAETYWPVQEPDKQKLEIDIAAGENGPPAPVRKERPFFRRAATLVVFLAAFTGALFATHAFLRNAGILPDLTGMFVTKTGRANTDINLRPSPNINNEPIGLVTKNSKVRIVKSQNNWYQVDVIEQGRQRDTALETNRGWLNGRYVDLD